MTPVPEPVLTASGSGRVAALTVDDGPERCRDRGPARPAARARGAGDLLRRRAGGHGARRGGGAPSHGGRGTPRGRPRDVLRRPRRLGGHAGSGRTSLGTVAVDPRRHWVTRRRRCRGSAHPTAAGGAAPRSRPSSGCSRSGSPAPSTTGGTQDVPTLVANLRAAIRPGGLVLVHDGGGDRLGTVQALRTVLPEWLADGWHFTRPAHPDLDDRQREEPLTADRWSGLRSTGGPVATPADFL